MVGSYRIDKFLIILLHFFIIQACYAKDTRLIKKNDIASLKKEVSNKEETIKKKILHSIDKQIDNEEVIQKLITNLRAVELELGNFAYTAYEILYLFKNSYTTGKYISEQEALLDIIRRSRLNHSTPLGVHPQEYVYKNIFFDNVFKEFFSSKKQILLIENISKINNSKHSFLFYNEQNLENKKVIMLLDDQLNSLIKTSIERRSDFEDSFNVIFPRIVSVNIYSNKVANVLAAYLLDSKELGDKAKFKKYFDLLKSHFPQFARNFSKFSNQKSNNNKNIDSFLSKTNADKHKVNFPFGILFFILFLVSGFLYFRRRNQKLNENRIKEILKTEKDEPKFDELLDLAGITN